MILLFIIGIFVAPSFTENTTNTYIDVLPKIIDSYNSSFHRSIKMTPRQARKKENELTVFDNLYDEPVAMKTPKFKGRYLESKQG